MQARQEYAEQEKRKIEEEKERLLSLDEKSLQVEMIFAIRGFYKRFIELEAMQEELDERLYGVESAIAQIESDISSLESEIRNITTNVN